MELKLPTANGNFQYRRHACQSSTLDFTRTSVFSPISLYEILHFVEEKGCPSVRKKPAIGRLMLVSTTTEEIMCLVEQSARLPLLQLPRGQQYCSTAFTSPFSDEGDGALAQDERVARVIPRPTTRTCSAGATAVLYTTHIYAGPYPSQF